MPDNPNIIINDRLENIKKRIGRLSFLLAHLKKFKADLSKIDNTSTVFDGVFQFFYYAFSYFILEIYKLFDKDNNEYYTLPKLLNHIESNIKYVVWYKEKTTGTMPNMEKLSPNKLFWSKEKTEWADPATGEELIKKQDIICDLKKKILENREEIDKIKLARDKVIAHIDKDFQKHNIRIELEMVEKLFLLAHEIFNTLYQELKGTSLDIEHVDSDTISILLPIKKYYDILTRLTETNITQEKYIPVEELNKIIFTNSPKPSNH